LKARELVIKCPKCNSQDYIRLSDEDFEILRHAGIVRFGFVHRGHILLVDIDTNLFVRGAYIVSYPTCLEAKLFYKDYRILVRPIVGVKLELIIFMPEEKIIDFRLCPSCLVELYDIIQGILDFSKKFSHLSRIKPKFVGIRGRRFNVGGDEKIVLLSPCRDSDSNHKSAWINVLFSVFCEMGVPSDDTLRRIISYVDDNLERKPSAGDVEQLKSFYSV